MSAVSESRCSKQHTCTQCPKSTETKPYPGRSQPTVHLQNLHPGSRTAFKATEPKTNTGAGVTKMLMPRAGAEYSPGLHGPNRGSAHSTSLTPCRRDLSPRQRANSTRNLTERSQSLLGPTACKWGRGLFVNVCKLAPNFLVDQCFSCTLYSHAL